MTVGDVVGTVTVGDVVETVTVGDVVETVTVGDVVETVRRARSKAEVSHSQNLCLNGEEG